MLLPFKYFPPLSFIIFVLYGLRCEISGYVTGQDSLHRTHKALSPVWMCTSWRPERSDFRAFKSAASSSLELSGNTFPHVVAGAMNEVEMLSQGISRLQFSCASTLRTNKFFWSITFSIFSWLISSKFYNLGRIYQA